MATLTGLRIPGPNPDLFVAVPVTVRGEAGLNAPDRPLTTYFTASAGNLRLSWSARVNVQDRTGEVSLTASAPAMTPVPGLSWQSASLTAHLTGSMAAPPQGQKIAFQISLKRELVKRVAFVLAAIEIGVEHGFDGELGFGMIHEIHLQPLKKRAYLSRHFPL